MNNQISMFLCLVLFSVSAAIGWAEEPEFSFDKISEFMTYYYLHPQPKRLPEILEVILASVFLDGIESTDEDWEYQLAYFFARASKYEPEILNQYTDLFEKCSHQQRLFMLKVLQLCGNEKTSHFFEANLRTGRFSKEQTYIMEAVKEGIPVKYDPMSGPIESPLDIMFLWTEFEITGDEKVIERIISVLPNAESNNDIDRFIGEAAIWSLVSKCKSHEVVQKICKRELATSTGTIRERLEEIISELDFPLSIEKLIENGRKHGPVTGAKAWALACTGVLWERNHDRHDLLTGEEVTERNISERQKLLSKWWGIESRMNLFDSVRSLYGGGHRKGFAELAKSVDGLTEVEYRKFIQSYSNDKEKARRIEIVCKYQKELGSKGILGWDYCRLICLCRWGYEVGYLRENEAWGIIIPVARELQETFESWEDLGRNYLIGIEYWGGDKDSAVMCEDAYQRLLDMPSSPWNKYPWEMELNFTDSSEATKPNDKSKASEVRDVSNEQKQD
jgi:hypothetical protein